MLGTVLYITHDLLLFFYIYSKSNCTSQKLPVRILILVDQRFQKNYSLNNLYIKGVVVLKSLYFYGTLFK